MGFHKDRLRRVCEACRQAIDKPSTSHRRAEVLNPAVPCASTGCGLKKTGCGRASHKRLLKAAHAPARRAKVIPVPSFQAAGARSVGSPLGESEEAKVPHVVLAIGALLLVHTVLLLSLGRGESRGGGVEGPHAIG